MKLQDIIQDLHALEERVRAYERKYGITSCDFYELYQAGLLDDDGFEKTQELTRWASAYEMKLERETAGASNPSNPNPMNGSKAGSARRG